MISLIESALVDEVNLVPLINPLYVVCGDRYLCGRVKINNLELPSQA